MKMPGARDGSNHWRVVRWLWPVRGRRIARLMTPTPERLRAALEGRYRIERELGEGGMATVYLAHDVKHDRKVALKVLKPEVAAMVGAARFLAEIRTTANLQHPHLLPLFDSGEADDALFYVMPHVPGETLADRLKREHQLPIAEAVRIATAVAQALDHAHRHGVIHRDIKPSNILLQEGEPLVADFGIALARDPDRSGRLTETGLSVGTPLYMSPEQALGGPPVGAASDIYSLACVLYEMLVGEPPFKGSTPQAILANVLMSEPVSATAHRRLVPPHVDGAIRQALQQLPADRFATASDFARALADPSFRFGEETAGAPAAAAADTRWRRRAMGLAAVTVVVAAASTIALTTARRSAPRAVVRTWVTPPEGQRFLDASYGVDVALAPDGSWFVYVGEGPGGKPQLWRRDLRSLEATAIAGTVGASSPTVSPDGRAIAFASDGEIRTLALAGGPTVTLAPAGLAPAWGPDGHIYFEHEAVVHRVAADGGPSEPFTARIENHQQYHVAVLPDGHGLVFTGFQGTPAQARIFAVGPSGGEPKEVVAGTMARYSESGHLIYATVSGTLWAARFDLTSLTITGPPISLVEGISVDRGATSQFALSRSGALVYGTGAGFLSELIWVSRDGTVEPVDPAWQGEFGSPSISPDGGRVAVTIQGPKSMDIWIKRLDRGPHTRLTLDGGRNDFPAWTPDGRSVTFTSDRASRSFDLWTRQADGSGEPVLELDETWAVAEALWSPDGKWLIHRTSTLEAGAGDIAGYHRAERGARVPFVASRFTEAAAAISPDGRWLAYNSNESGFNEVTVVPFPDARNARWPVSVNGGVEPVWSRDGRELFYRNREGAMVAVRVNTVGGFSVGPATTLFSAATFQRTALHRQYDVSPDGKRFLMIRPVGAGRDRQLILVQDFAAEIDRAGSPEP